MDQTMIWIKPLIGSNHDLIKLWIQANQSNQTNQANQGSRASSRGNNS
jgi:hypothetical protein